MLEHPPWGFPKGRPPGRSPGCIRSARCSAYPTPGLPRSRWGPFTPLHTWRRKNTPVLPWHSRHCLNSSCIYFDSAQAPYGQKLHFFLEGAWMDTRRDKGGWERKAVMGQAHRIRLVLSTVVPLVDGSCLAVSLPYWAPGGSSPTTQSDGHHGHQQRAGPGTAGCPPSSLGYP